MMSCSGTACGSCAVVADVALWGLVPLALPMSGLVSGRGDLSDVLLDAPTDRRLVPAAVTKCAEEPQPHFVVWFEAGGRCDVLVVFEVPFESDLREFVETTDQGVDDVDPEPGGVRLLDGEINKVLTRQCEVTVPVLL